ncbi:hypothetical protein [Phreatobacter sp.]|uniref:hypothetical protein n=1 Tax=Phreatobacter sp. TaxID=1966341 RepID=UPI0022CA4609|nr:hypothetical protein [Phreatobacter sp.]MCZ8315949.1 hypothetical protein [Phreatobacter sp.]
MSQESGPPADGPAAQTGDRAWLFRAVTGQTAAADHLSHPGDAAQFVTDLLASSDYRNRFRDAAREDADIVAAVELWPPETRPHDLHIFVVTGDPWSKSRASIERLAPRLGDRLVMTVLTGKADDEPFPDVPGLELIVIPGQSIFQLRARLPEFMKESAWVISIEDHSVPTQDWLDGLLATLATVPSTCLAVTGTAANLTSTKPWAWANFLFNFYRHWHPAAAPELGGTVATTAFRRDMAGRRPFAIHAFESRVLGRSMPVSNAFPVNHTQHTRFIEATLHVIDNGLVYGASLRRNHLRPRSALFHSVRHVLGGRMRDIAEVLAVHPRRAELPPGTLARIRWIAWCHSLGAVLGALVGSGRAHLRLE